MSDPFLITEPTVISFSGGRTSAYMLWRILQAHGGVLPPEALICFANTGKEDAVTLRFVQDCSEQWNVPITWLEYRVDGYAVVDYATASRNGEPFEALIQKRKYLPNTFARFCTSELKIVPMKKHLKSLEHEDIVTFVGIRADEPRRVAKMKTNEDIKETPLATANVTVAEVLSFWDKQPFNLQTITVNGNSLLSNYDLCFLKKADHLLGLIQDKPERAVWWANMEQKIGARFNQAHPSYEAMLNYNEKQRDMFDLDEESISCFCGD